MTPELYHILLKNVILFSRPVLGRRVNRGAGHGLEVPVRFIFQGHRKAVEWVQKKIKTADNDIHEGFSKPSKMELSALYR